MNTQDYARWFRASTPYISAYRQQTFVVLLPGKRSPILTSSTSCMIWPCCTCWASGW